MLLQIEQLRQGGNAACFGRKKIRKIFFFSKRGYANPAIRGAWRVALDLVVELASTGAEGDVWKTFA